MFVLQPVIQHMRRVLKPPTLLNIHRRFIGSLGEHVSRTSFLISSWLQGFESDFVGVVVFFFFFLLTWVLAACRRFRDPVIPSVPQQHAGLVSLPLLHLLLLLRRFIAPPFYPPVALVNMINSTSVFFLSAPLPDDHSRVRLQALEGEQSSDYINANYVDVSTHTSQRHQRKGHCASSRGERGRWCRRRRGASGTERPRAVCPSHKHTHTQEQCLFIQV